MTVAVSCAVVLACAAGAAPRDLVCRAGESEKWAFAAAGKPIGTMDATCTSVRKGAASGPLCDWRFGLKLDLNVQGRAVKLAMKGTFTLNSKGRPTVAAINATVNGQAQKATITFAGRKAAIASIAGGQAVRKGAPITGQEYLSINNVMTLLSLATRTLGVQPGQTVKAPFFAVEMMGSLDFTLTAKPKTETVTVGGKKVECVVCDVSPIGARIHLSKATGEMVRYAMESQGLVITRR